MSNEKIVPLYTATGNIAVDSSDPDRAEIDSIKAALRTRTPQIVDTKDLADRELPPLDFTLGPLGLLSRACGVMAGLGGVGKGYAQLGLAASVACEDADIPFFGIPELPAPPKRGRVVLFSVEDPLAVLNARTQALLRVVRQTYGVKAMRSLERNLHYESLFGLAPCLLAKGAEEDNHCRAWQEFIAEKVYGSRLFSMDTASCIHRADENSNGEMTVLLQVVNRIAEWTGASGLLPHHSPKDAPGNVRGASAIANSARWVLSLVGRDERRGEVNAQVQKENNGPPLPDFLLIRGEGGIFRGRAASAAARPRNRHLTSNPINLNEARPRGVTR